MNNLDTPVGDKVEMSEEVAVRGSLHAQPGCKAVLVSIDKKAKTAEVCFERVPNHPTVCARCGSSHGLSRDGGSGEIVCLITGCGHEHGFSPVTISVPLAKIK